MTAPIYRRILVASGGAPHSLKAVERAVALAEHFGAPLEIVAVVPIGANALLNLAAGLPGGELLEAEAVRNDAHLREAHLRATAADARARGLAVREHLVEAARPADAILAVARETGADLIVLGRRHTTALSAAVAGSTGNAVSHVADVDVLVAR